MKSATGMRTEPSDRSYPLITCHDFQYMTVIVTFRKPWLQALTAATIYSKLIKYFEPIWAVLFQARQVSYWRRSPRRRLTKGSDLAAFQAPQGIWSKPSEQPHGRRANNAHLRPNRIIPKCAAGTSVTIAPYLPPGTSIN